VVSLKKPGEYTTFQFSREKNENNPKNQRIFHEFFPDPCTKYFFSAKYSDEHTSGLGIFCFQLWLFQYFKFPFYFIF